MLAHLRRLIERQMARAAATGQLSGLEGEGRPLPDRPGETDAALSAGMRMMHEAGVVPEEFTLQKELDAARKALAALPPSANRSELQARVADLEMRTNMAREARRAFLRN